MSEKMEAVATSEAPGGAGRIQPGREGPTVSCSSPASWASTQSPAN